jgi:hypothetical protein
LTRFFLHRDRIAIERARGHGEIQAPEASRSG